MTRKRNRAARRKRIEAANAAPKKEYMANMGGRFQAMSNTAGLFSPCQFASITDTLVKASQRRDAELQQRMNRQRTPAPTVQTSYPEPSVTPVSEFSHGSDSGDSRAELEPVHEDSEVVIAMDDHSAFDRTFSTSGAYDPQVWLRGDYGTDGTDDPKRMLANPDQMQQPFGMNAKVGVAKVDEAQHKSAKLENVDPSAEQTGIVNPIDDDPRAMLADLESKTPKSSGMDVKNEAHNVDGPKQNLTETDRLEALASKLDIDDDEPDRVSNPKAMLEEIDSTAKIAKQVTTDDSEADSYDDPKAMLADLDAKTQDSEDDDDDLDALREKLTTMLSPARKLPSQDVLHTIQDTPAPKLEAGSIPYAVALMLESTGIKWEDAKAWCTYLFSSGMDGYEAKKERVEYVKREQVKLDALIEQTLKEEKEYLAVEEKNKLPFRLIVSNLAAGVDTDAIRIFFKDCVWDIVDVTLLPDRDPVKRTRTAYVDMDSRKAAVRASYEVGGIYGLVVKIKLAVE